MTQHPHSENTSVSSEAHQSAPEAPQGPVMKGNHLLLETMGILQHQHDAHLPYDNQTDTERSLSVELTGDDRLQAYLMADYLSKLDAEETQQVASLLASDTMAYLQQLAQDYTNDATETV